MLSVGKVAARYGVHPATVRRWDAEGRLTSVRINARGDRRFRVADLPAVFEGHQPGALVRAVGYARASGSQGQVTSVAAQEAELRAVAASRGWEFTAVFKDVGSSGLSETRRGLTRLLAGAKEGAFEQVLVTHPDRLARFGVGWLRMLLDSFGVGLVVVHEQGQVDVHDELVADFVSLVASFSGRLYGQRSAAARRRLLAQAAPAERCTAAEPVSDPSGRVVL